MKQIEILMTNIGDNELLSLLNIIAVLNDVISVMTLEEILSN